MQSKILRYPDLKIMVGLSRIQIRRLEREGKFPQRLQLSPNCVGWHTTEIQQWLEHLPRKDQTTFQINGGK
jgi:prophage regulatory protein